MPAPRGSLLVAAVVFGLLFLSLNQGALLYLYANPGSFHAADAVRSACRALAQGALAAGLLLGARALGRPLLARMVAGAHAPAWQPVLELGLGLSAASTALFLAGLAGLFRPSAVGAAAVALCGLGWLEAGRARWRLVELRPEDVWASAAAGLLAYLAWSAVARALAPPTDIDVLKYHLALPKLFLRSGRIEDIPWLVFSHWPQLIEMPYSLALALRGEGAAALVHTGLCAALVWLAYLLARDEWGPRAALASALILAAQPVVYNQAGLALNDGVLALFYLLSCACLWHRRATGVEAWLRPAGLMAGAAAAVKYHGLMLILGLALWPLLSGRGRKGTRDAAAFLSWAALVAGPWYLKSWLGSGNPVWPFLPGLFGGQWGAASVAAWLSPNLSGIADVEWTLFGEGAVFLLVPAGVAAVRGWLKGERPSALCFLMLLPAPVYLARFAASASLWRYLLPFYPALALLGGWGVERGFARGGRGAVLAALALAAGLGGAARASHNNALYPLLGLRSSRSPGLSPREAYLARALPGYGLMREINALVGPGGRVLLVADNRGYYLDADYMQGDPPEQGVLDYASASGPEELRRRLGEWGITHVAVSREDDWYATTLRRLAPRTYALIEATVARYGTEVARVGASGLYALNPGSSGR